MNQKLKEILSQVYELEGLLLLVGNHEKNTDSFVFDLIREKSEKINYLSQSFSPSIFDINPASVPLNEAQSLEEMNQPKYEMLGADSCGVECDVDDETQTENLNSLREEIRNFETLGADTNYDPDDEDEFYENSEESSQSKDENIEVTNFDGIEDLDIKNDENPPHIEDDEPQEIWTSNYQEPQKNVTGNKSVDFSKEINENNELTDEELPEFEPEEELESGYKEVDSNDIDSDQESDGSDDSIEEYEEEDDTDDEDEVTEDDEYEAESRDDADNDEIIRVGDLIQRDISRNIKKAFTLNDRFRFRRELFENSDVQMTNTLNMIEAMQSFSEAEDYFYNDLEWDKDSTEVQEFMEIIKKHFN